MDDRIRFQGKTVEEWEEIVHPKQPSDEDLTELGVLRQDTSREEEGNTGKKLELAERQDYENLGYWDTVKDELTAGAVELSKFVTPKKYELNYTPRTKAGEAFQTFSKYLYGFGGLMAGGSIAGMAKGALLAKKATGLAKVAGGLETVLSGNKFFKTSKVGLKAFGVGALNVGTQGILQGGILDATIHEENEGRMADLFGDTENAFVSWLQTDPNDLTAEAKLKNVIDGALFGIGLNGVVSGVEGVLGRLFKNVKLAKAAKDAGKEIPDSTAKEVAQDTTELAKTAKTSDLVDTVKKIRDECQTSGEDASQKLIDVLSPENIEDGQAILKMLDEGEEIFVHGDGTFDISVSKYEDAYKVSEEEYKKQLEARDKATSVIDGKVRHGDTAIEHQNQAVKDTWTNRGWIGENEELTKTNAAKIVARYKEKFKIDNNIKVEFVDGLKSNGKTVEGNTTQTTFLGKNKKSTKAAQTRIDKKKLEIQKLKDKITMLEGGNAEVSDPLDILKEKLRIASNELKDLTDIPQPEKIGNITIQIDSNAEHPYATLRAELEHARDLAKGEVPQEEGKHFARYTGANEAEVAPSYTYKKSKGRAKAFGLEADSAVKDEAALQNVTDNGQTPSNKLELNQENINGQRTDKNSERTISSSDSPNQIGRGEIGTDGQNSRTISENDSQRSNGNRLFIRRNDVWIVDTNSKNTFNNNKVSKVSYKELSQDVESGNSFYNAISQAKADLGALGASVHTYTPEEYSQMRCFLSEDGMSGIAVKSDGDIVSVFSNPNAKINDFRSRGHALVELAKQNGGTKLDAFDTYLPDFYKKHGFEETGRDIWNEQYKPNGWDKEFYKKYNNGEPDVVYMELKNKSSKLPEETTTKQLKIDFSQATAEVKNSEELVDAVTSGKAEITKPEDVAFTVEKTIDLDPEISGTTWEALSKDADKLADVLIEADNLGYTDDIYKAMSMNDVKTLDEITRKALAAQKLSSHLADKLATLGEDPPIETMSAVIDMIDYIKRYTKETGSAEGRSLGARRFIKKAFQTFGSLRLSELTKAGISELSDLSAAEAETLPPLKDG